MGIISSSYTLGVQQADGRVPVTETHVAEGGQLFSFEYLNDGIDPQLILEARASRINAELAARDAAQTAATESEVAILPIDFLYRFTAQERIDIRIAAETDPVVRDFMHLLECSPGVRRSLALPGLQYLQSVNLLTQQRVIVIGDF